MPGEGGKLYRRIMDTLAGEIADGRYAIGTRLPAERDLTERFGVSRPTVREAMIALELQGLVEARKGAGVFVLANSSVAQADELDIGAFELTEARRLLEGEVAAVAAVDISDGQLRELAGLVRRMAHDDSSKVEETDRGFHLLIAEATGNSIIAHTVTEFWDMRHKSPLARRILAKAGGLGIESRLAEHRAILEALTARSPERARAAMHEHLNRVMEHLLTVTETEAVERAKAEVSLRRQALTRRAV